MKELQNKFLVFAFAVFIIIFLLLASFIAGVFFEKSRTGDNTETRNITSQVIIDKIDSEAFLVSRTVYLDQEVEIVIDQGSKWSNFFWGQTIKADALVRTDLGVDYTKITEEDINVDHRKKVITVNIPSAEILDANVNGKIQVETQNGLFKYIFDNDPNEDHNLATEELISEARTTIASDSELLEEAKNDSIKILKLVLKDFGYEVVIE